MSISALSNPALIAQELQKEANEDASNAANAESVREQGVEFLQLLLVQLENQNPLEPTDTNELTNQLLQQSQLEQQIRTNEKLDSFLTQLEANAGFSSINYIGNEVEVLGNNGVIQNNQAQWSYVVDGEADFVELTVTDAAGNVLYQEEGNTIVDAHTFTFNAADSDIPLEEGQSVFLFVNALDESGESLDGLISSYVTVDGVDGSGSSEVITAGNAQYSLPEILKITSASQ